ncbi:MAG: xanthine dehydrogenase family protein molybdopterin-binding subunit [Burkholderiales bacterium]
MSLIARGSGIGEPVRRKEDVRLITGEGCFSDDISLPGQAYAVFVRSPHAHSRIRSIDKRRALAVPGVITVLTGKDLLADGLKPLPHKPLVVHPAEPRLANRDGSPIFNGPHYPLALDKTRHVGEAVAVVIARTIDIAKDGAEQVEVDYEVLPSVTGTLAAAEPDAPRLWDTAPSNVCLDAELGSREATAAAFARATHVVKLDTWVQRVTGVPMEPRAAVGEFDAATQRYTLHAGNGGAVRLKQDLALVLGVPAQSVRVVIGDVGGNFGTRGMIYPEFAVVAWAARRIGRPVKWTCERNEAFVSDYQGRDLAVTAELALDADGVFLAMRGSNVSNVGSHPTNFGPLKKGVEIMSSIYRVPAAHFRARAVMSNTTPTRPYRSAGRPEVIFVMERLIDLAAREHGFDRVELRRRNLLTAVELPCANPFGLVYDNGNYPEAMEKALRLGDWAGFSARRAEARRRGRCRGIGVANYVDTATGVPRERADVTVHADGHVDVVIGIVSNGQSHETTFAQLVTEWLGVPLDRVRVIAGDTDIVKVGGGAHSGRGMRMGSVVIWKSVQQVLARGTRVAARLLEADPSVIRFEHGGFRVEGSGRSAGLFEVAAAAMQLADLPADLRGPLAAFSDETFNDASFPYGCHVCEVEVDPELGTVEIVRYSAVDDVGRAVNPMVVHGQIHGGIAQGVGQALMEQCYYDPGTGQPLTGSFMDYSMPRADNFPFFAAEISEVPCTTHPLGMRPAGEGGTTPALGVVMNAIVDALADYGVKHIEMPATPERIWRAIREARSASKP